MTDLSTAHAGSRWRHVKRGTCYEVIGPATLQTATYLADEAALVVYRGEDGKLWAREPSEFLDGRFESVATAHAGELRAVGDAIQRAWNSHDRRVFDLPPIDLSRAEMDCLAEAAIAARPAAPDVARLEARVKALREERDTAQSAVEAWASACESLEAHLEDRVAMQDAASPEIYLSILRGNMAGVQRFSEQVRASRWHEAAIMRERVKALEAALRALEQANDNLCAVRSQQTYDSMEAEGRDQLYALDEARRNARALLSGGEG